MSTHYRARTLLGLMAICVLLIYCTTNSALYNTLEKIAHDQLAVYVPKMPVEPRVVIVDIDEKSIAEVGAWPWPRSKIADLIRALTEQYQVALLGVDIVFPEPKIGDDGLKLAFSSPNVVLSQVLDFSPQTKNRVGTLSDLSQVQEIGNDAERAKGYIANHALLLPSFPQVGHISPVMDEDGKVRRIYPIACLVEGCSQALSFRMFQALNGVKVASMRMPKSGVLEMSFGHVYQVSIPVDATQSMIIPYRVAAGGFTYVSASDVLAGRVPQRNLENLLVLLGSTALGLGDHVVTPLDKLTPGIEIHAQLLSAALDHAFITPVAATPWMVVVAGLVIGLAFLVWPWRGIYGMFFWVLGMLLLVGCLSYLMYAKWSYLLPLSPMPFNIVLLGLLGMVFESARLSRQVKSMASRFNRFLPAPLVKNILSEHEVVAKMERQILSVLIADMRGFTEASEGRQPEEVAELAQRCLEVQAEVVYRFGGTVEKYTGDGLMAIWGAPLEDDEHALHAVRAGLAIQEAVSKLVPWFLEKGFKPLKVSVGINTGQMAVGVIGGASHLIWSAQGDAFNTATRIEQLTRSVGQDLLVGLATAQLIGMQNVTHQGSHFVKGLSQPVDVYSLNSAFCRDLRSN